MDWYHKFETSSILPTGMTPLTSLCCHPSFFSGTKELTYIFVTTTTKLQTFNATFAHWHQLKLILYVNARLCVVNNLVSLNVLANALNVLKRALYIKKESLIQIQVWRYYILNIPVVILIKWIIMSNIRCIIQINVTITLFKLVQTYSIKLLFRQQNLHIIEFNISNKIS